jgi:hypothetical protein
MLVIVFVSEMTLSNIDICANDNILTNVNF